MKSIPNPCRQLTIICLLMVTLFSSCSKDSSFGGGAERRAELVSILPDDATITVSFSPAAILKSAGMEVSGNSVKPSKAIERLADSNGLYGEAIKFITEAKGIDYSAAVVAGGTENGYILFALSDAHKFCDWAKSKDMTVTNSDSYIICYKNPQSPAIVIDGLTAWFIGAAADADKALSIVESSKSAAADKKIAQWKIDRLVEDDINVLVNVEAYSKEMYSAFSSLGLPIPSQSLYSTNCKYTSSDINFDGPTVRMVGEAFDNDGNLTTIFNKDEVSTVPSSVLALVKNSQIAVACTLPDALKSQFVSYIMDIVAIQNPGFEYADILKQSFDAMTSFTLGISTRDDMSIANFKPTDIMATLAIGYDRPAAEKAVTMIMPEVKKFGADKEFSEIWNALSGQSTYTFSPEDSMPDFKLYLTGKDNTVFITTDSAISDLKLSADPKLEGLIAYSVINLKKSHPGLALTNCPFGIDSRFTSTNEKSEGYITLTDTDGPILETLITFISRFL